MATIPFTSGTYTIGDDGSTLTRFVDNTRIWAGGTTTFSVTDTMSVTGSAIVEADSCTIKVIGNPASGSFNSGLWNHGSVAAADSETGTYVFSNVQIQSHNAGAAASTNNNLTFTDVTWTSTGLTDSVSFGNWRDDESTFILNGFNIWFNPVSAGSTQSSGNFFVGNVSTSLSRLNGISLWNGQVGDGILGCSLTFNPRFVFSGLQSGPIGTTPLGSNGGAVPGSTRLLFRCAGLNSVSTTEAGVLLGYDYRGINGQAGSYAFTLDRGARLWIINPLQGAPADGLQFGNAFNSSDDSVVVLAVGNKPSSRAADVTIVNGDGSDTMYSMPSNIQATILPTEIVSDITTLSDSPNGILFSNQIETIGQSGFSGVNVETVSHKSYVTYSWQQLDWGTVRTVLTPAASSVDPASDANIESIRNSGAYPDVIQGTGFVTELDINEEDDVITAGFATHASAVAGLHGAGRADNARDAVASVKAAQYATIATGGVLGLEYDITGLEADFGLKNLTFVDSNGTPDPTAATITIPTTSLNYDVDDTITSLIAANITVGGTILDSALEKASLFATGTLTLTGATVQNLTCEATGITCGAGTVISRSRVTANSLNTVSSLNTFGDADDSTSKSNTYAAPASGNTVIDINFTGGLTAGSTVTIEQLIGNGYTIADGDSIRINSNVTNLTVEASDDSNLLEGTNVTISVPSVTYSVRPAGELADIRARGGYFAIKSGSTTILPRVDIDSSTTLGDVTMEKDESDNSMWTAYYKPATGWGSTRSAYDFTIDTFGTIDSDRPIPVSEIPSVLVSGSTVEPILGHGAYTQTGAGTTTTLRIGIDANPGNPGGANNMLNSGETQALCLEAANSLAYFDVHFSNNRTTQLFNPDINNGSTWLTDDEVIFVSSDTATNPAQQIVSQISGGGPQGSLPTQSNGYPEVLAVAEASASLPTVQSALDLSLVAVKENHQVLLTATQRGAVKAATYSAGDLNL